MNHLDVALFAATVAEEAKDAGLPAPAGLTTSALVDLFSDGPLACLEEQVQVRLYALLGRGEYDGMRWYLDEGGEGCQLHIPGWGYLRTDVKYPIGGDFYYVKEK